MERQVLDSLYLAQPERAFGKALAGEQLDRVSLQFLLDHAPELDAERLVILLGKPVAKDVERRVEPFVRRLADVLAGAGVHWVLETLKLARTLDEDAWADLTRRLRGRLPNWQWYRFVDRVRGGQVFNALNTPPQLAEHFVTSVEEARREPLVVPLLEEPTNDLKAAAYALTLPIDVLLRVHGHLPDLVRLDDVRSALAGRLDTNDDRWEPPLPEWMAPYVIERLRHCSDDEALALYEWLSGQRNAAGGDLFEIALDRFKRSPLTREWHLFIGERLTTGKAWKTRGRRVIEFCVKFNRGFPQDLTVASLGAATAESGANIEKHRAAILRVMHDVTASIFVVRAESALKDREWEKSRTTLRALLCLDPGGFIGGAIRHLHKAPDLPEDVSRLVDACVRLAGSGGKAPTDATFHEAFLVLSGSLP